MSVKHNDIPAFGPESLDALIGRLNQEFPAELRTDWRAFVKKQFRMTPDQELSLDHAPPHIVEEIQEYFRQAADQVKNDGRFHGKIVKLAPEKQTVTAVHEVHLSVETARPSPQLSIIIAHCDANCKNWGWGPP